MAESPRPPLLSTPVAVLAGSVIIAIAVYLGLRERGGAGTSADGREPPAVGSPAGTSTAIGAAATPQTGPKTVDVAAATSAAAASLEKHRKLIVDGCWGAEVKGSVRYGLNFNFGPDGKQISRGMTEPRGAPLGVVNCVQKTLPPIAIPPQGEAVSVEIELTLP